MGLLKNKNYYASASPTKLAFQKFFKNKLALISLFFLVFVLILATLGYLITPDKTPFANDQNLELATKKPGFNITILEKANRLNPNSQSWLSIMLYGKAKYSESIPIYRYEIIEDSIEIETYTGMNPNNGDRTKYAILDVCYALDKSKSVTKKNGIYTFYDQAENKLLVKDEDLLSNLKSKHLIKKKFIFGTDKFGRDVLSQLIIGTRVSLSVGFIAVIISLLIGVSLGAIAGYFGKFIDNLIVWFINVVWSIPTLLLVIAITMALGKGYWQVFIAVGLTMWVEVARVVRGQVLSLRKKEFVEAGTALGYSHFRIIFKHILPNVLSPLIVISAANFASAILIEAGLSFLGIGVQPPTPSWGIMIKEHYAYIILDYAYLAIIPGLAIMLMVLAFMVIGNGLRDALDVKLIDD